MVKRKSSPRKTRNNKRTAKPKDTLKKNLRKTIAGVFVLIFLVVAAGWIFHYLMKPRQPVKTSTLDRKPPAFKKPAFEIYPEEDVPPRKPEAKPSVPLAGKRPQIAIIIDDLGYDRQIARKFTELDAVLTFSVLPYSTHQNKIADAIRSKGFELMLHLPMEPVEYPAVNPGKGALLTSMTPNQLLDQLIKDLETIPDIKGVNNHMGSKMTTVSTQLYQIFSILKKRNLYFIDSRTTTETLCKPSARLFNLSFAQRDVFLDNIQNPGAIRKQINQLLLIANSHGEAIGIGHPHPATLEVLREMLPNIKEKVRLVPASAVVYLTG